MKTCKTCGQEKELDLYYNNKKAKDGKQASCIACERVRLAKYQTEKKALKDALNSIVPDEVKTN